MRKIISKLALLGIVVVSMTACSSKPSDEEIINAIKEGRMSSQQVIEEGLMTEEELKDAGVISQVAAIDKLSMGPKLNNFSTTDMKGNEVTEEVFKNVEKGTRVVFWRTDNEESVQEIKELNEIYKDAKEAGYEFIGIFMDSENKEKAEEICKDIEFINIPFEDTMKESLGETGMGMLEKYPVANLCDSEGNLILAWSGGITDKEALKDQYDEN